MTEIMTNDQPLNDSATTESKKTNIPREVDIFFRTHQGTDDFTIKLYEKLTRSNGKIKKEFLQSYHGELPDEDQIKEDYGAGDYLLWSNVLDDNGNNLYKEIAISKIFGKGKVRREAEAAQAPAVLQQNKPVDPFETFERVMKIANPTIERLISAFQSRPQTDNFESLQRTMLKGQVESMQQLGTAYQKMLIDKIKEEGKKGNNDDMEKSFLKEVVLDAYEGIKKYLPDYLSANRLEQKIYDKMLQKNDTYQAVMSDSEAANQLYSVLCADPEVGEVKAAEFAQRAGLQVGDAEEAEEYTSDPFPDPSATATKPKPKKSTKKKGTK